MKPKDYWDKSKQASNPFELFHRISHKVEDRCSKESSESSQSSIRYIWVYLTHEGLSRCQDQSIEGPALDLDDWLNVVDESAAMGAEWMMIYAGASLSSEPFLWPICRWAQETHGIQVGLQLTDDGLSEEDIAGLTRLDASMTYVVADKANLSSLRFLDDHGIRVCEANIDSSDRTLPCSAPENIACVGPDGRMFSCGLVLGDQRYALGASQDRKLRDVKNDASLPHAVPDSTSYSEHGCDGCPPLIAQRLTKLTSK